jgi:O-antigen ligase
MDAYASLYREKPFATAGSTLVPSNFVEYGFFFYMFYTLIGGVLGLFVNNLASGLLVLLVLFCLYEVGFQALSIVRVLAFPLGCAIVYIFIQLFFFDESLTETVRPFLIWMLLLFLIQLLALRAKFLHRFVVMMFVIGLAALPYISFYQAGEAMQRARIDRAIGFHHTNAMGEWYGFCAVYFLIFGWMTRTNALRFLSWASGILCLYVVTLTVSRGALLAIAVATVVGSRKLLKNGFLPLLLLSCVCWLLVELGIFEETARLYSARGAEDSGRLAVWPLIIDSFLNSPWIGVGHSHVGAMTNYGQYYTPHNGFLYIAQSSGIVPLALFLAYWLRVVFTAIKTEHMAPETVFYLPFLTFTFLTVNVGNFTFMQLSAIASLAFPMAVSAQQFMSRLER